jgi:16S rRNA (cytidine1402-2'-O)-methyltransferase
MPLFIVATPIGNLSDLSVRARSAFEQAEFVAAEDTRVTRKLFSALGISAPKLLRYSRHVEEASAQGIVQLLEAGKRVVLVTDAGTPCVSDPGEVLVRLCHESGIEMEVLPGPSAVAAALSGSGLPGTPHHFLGFPPRKPGPLRKWLTEGGAYPGSLVVYESPQRSVAFAVAVAEILPDREICMCREISKMHEELLLLPVAEMAVNLTAREKIKGEVVFVIGPGEAPTIKDDEPVGSRLKEIAAALGQRWGCTKKEAYDAILSLENER